MQSGNTFDDFSFSIALVNYKTPEVTKLCLELLHKALDVNKVPVWVVDNDSKDDSLVYLKSLDWIKLIERTPVANEHGFMAHGRALDMILERVDTDYLLLLHTDTLIYDAAVIKRMLEQLSKNQKAAAIGCFEQVNRTRLQTMWRVAIRAVKYYFRRLKVALGISTRDPRLFYEVYLKSFCTLWNVGVIRQHQMSFAMVERIPGYEMQDRLRELGYDFLSIPPRQMFKYLDHIEAGTVAHVRGLAKNHKRVKNYQAIMNKTKKL
jgi:glycosyltransferase involved in cell wall biosynthesis